MAVVSPHLSIITKSVNGLHSPNKRQTSWIKFFLKRPNYMLPIRNSFLPTKTHRLKMKEQKKICHANENQNGTGLAIFISGKIIIFK